MDRELLRVCNERMNTADVVYMTTMRDGYPCTRAMLNLRNRDQYPDHQHLYESHRDDLMTYLITNTSSRKQKEIAEDPRVCLYFCHPSEFFGLSLVGELQIVEDMETKLAVWADNLAQYVPTGKPTDPDYSLLQFFPIEISGWNQGRKFAFAILS